MNLGPTELLIIAGVLVLLFGATKLPKLARSMGESARIFKSETKGLRQDGKSDEDDTAKAEEPKSETKQLPEATVKEPLAAEPTENGTTEAKDRNATT